MRAWQTLLGAFALGVVTYFAVLRIAESKNEAAVGRDTYSLASGHARERDAFEALRAKLEQLGQGDLAARLERLRLDNQLWVAPSLGSERWAVFVRSLGLVRRVYIREAALLDPSAHLYEHGTREGSELQQEAFAWLSLGGALRHELAHYDGALDEATAYEQELAWYGAVRQSTFLASADAQTRRTWEWALESAELSARKAAREAAGS